MKLRSGLISAIAVSVLTLAALTGVTGAAPASAATYHHLCLRENNATVSCMQSQGKGQDLVMADPSRSDLTNWVYPANGDTGLIQQANTNLCMQLNWDAAVIIEATCNSNLTYQLWESEYDSNTARTVFQSIWAAYNEGPYADYITSYGTSYGSLVGVQEAQFAGGDDQWGTS